MTLDDLVQTPASAPLEQVPPDQKKPYWEILNQYRQYSQQNPDVPMSMPEFAGYSNTATGTNAFDEGANDSALRRGGVNITNLTRHFGGFEPGSVLDKFGVPSPSKLFGGPQEGVDLPEIVGGASTAGLEKIGTPHGLAEAVGGGIGLGVKAAPVIGAGLIPGVGQILAPAVAGAETYGETGRTLPAAISAATVGALGPASRLGEQLFLKGVGAPTVKALEPELLALKSEAEATALGATRVPTPGWGPTALVQRGAQGAGRVAGFVGAGEVGTAAQTLVDPNLSWRDKAAAIGQQFTPSSLATSAVSQLPFLLWEASGAVKSPLNRIRAEVGADFANRYVEAAAKGDPESGSPGFAATNSQIAEAATRLMMGETPKQKAEDQKPPVFYVDSKGVARTELTPEFPTKEAQEEYWRKKDPVGQVLKSMGLEPPEAQPLIKTKEGDWAPGLAIEATRDATNNALFQRGLSTAPIGAEHSATLGAVVRGVERSAEGSLSRDEFVRRTTVRMIDLYDRFKGNLNQLGTLPEHLRGGKDFPPQYEALMDAKIVAAITPGSDTYNRDTHIRQALISGDQEEWDKLGLGPIHTTALGEAFKALNKVDPNLPPLEVTRRTDATSKLSNNIINMWSRLPPKPTLGEEVQQHQRSARAIDEEIVRRQNSTDDPIDDAEIAQFVGLRDKHIKLAEQLSNKETWERGDETPLDSATFAARRLAYNYGNLASTPTLDINDPKSVAKFARDIMHAMGQAETDWLREREGGATIAEKHPTLENALAAVDRLEAEKDNKQKETGYFYKYRVPKARDPLTRKMDYAKNPDGTYNVVEQKYRSTQGGLGAETEGQRELTAEASTQQERTLKALDELPEELFSQRFKDLGNLSDPAEGEARKAAMAQNIVNFINGMSDTHLKLLIEDRTGVGMKNPARLKSQFIAYVHFLQMGGRIDTFKDKDGHLKAVKGSDLAGLNVFMGPIGFGKDLPTHPTNPNGERTYKFNESNAARRGGMTFFDQFAVLANEIRKHQQDPRSMKADPEGLPSGNFAFVPHGVANDIDKALTYNRVEKITGQRPAYAKMGEFTEDGPEGVGVVKLTDPKTGEERRFLVAYNPLEEFFVKSTKHGLVGKVGDLADMFLQYVPDATPEHLFALRTMLQHAPYLRDMPVGSRPTIDPNVKGYTHNDYATSGAGMLLNPYEPDPSFLNPFRLMAPKDILPHFIDEIAHGGTMFAYNMFPEFRGQVNDSFKYVKEYVESMKQFAGADYASGLDHALSRPEELLAAMFHNADLHRVLKGIKDPFDTLPRTERTGTMFDRLLTILRELFSRMFGIDTAGTMLNRVSELSTRGFELQKGLPVEWSGNIYDFLYSKGLIGTVIRATGPEAVPRSVEPTQTYRQFATEPVWQGKPGGPMETKEQRADPVGYMLWEDVQHQQASLAFAKWNGAVLSPPFYTPERTLPSGETESAEELRARSRPRIGAYDTPEVIQRRLTEAEQRLAQYDAGTLPVEQTFKDSVVRDRESALVDWQTRLVEYQKMPDTNPNKARLVEQATKQIELNQALIPVLRRFVEAPEGQVFESRQQEETPEFKNWFAGSKVVDETGKPKVMYHHSTTGGFDVFKPYSHFGTPEQAEFRFLEKYPYYTTSKHPSGFPEEATMVGPNKLEFEPWTRFSTYPIYLNIKNPIRMTDQEANMVTSDPKLGKNLGATSYDQLRKAGYDGIVYRNEMEAPQQRADSWVAFDQNQVKSALGNRGTFDPTSGNILESRLGLLMPIAGNKARAFEQEDVKRVVQDFARRSRTVIDTFSGTGKTTEVMKDLGVKTTVLNVKDPRYFALFNEVKDNSTSLADRFLQAVEPIESPREAKPPYMKDGSDIRTYLARVEQDDPTVGLLLRQQFMPRGREVVEGQPSSSPRAQVTTTGLRQLPNTIKKLSGSIDKLWSMDGWKAVDRAKAGQGAVVDPPYVNSANRYAQEVRTIKPEERIRDYERSVIPAAKRGVNLMVFDNADPKLMDFLEQNGFQVTQFTRPRATQSEFVATNGGQVLESRANPQAVLDAMRASSTYPVEDREKFWFKPYDLQRFRDTFGPAFGDKLKLTVRAGQWGYEVPRDALDRVTTDDLSRMPQPTVKPYTFSLFEALTSQAKEQGSDDATANAVAQWAVSRAALLKNSDQTTWLKSVNDVGGLLGFAYTDDPLAGLTPLGMSQRPSNLIDTVQHESGHRTLRSPDVVASVERLNQTFEALPPEGRIAFIEGLNNLTDEGLGIDPQSLVDPEEFSATFIGRVGDMLANVPKPSAYLRDTMRFAPDEVSDLLMKDTLRRMQGIDLVRALTKQTAMMRGVDPKQISNALDVLWDTFAKLSRPALEIAQDITDFQHTRLMFPDTYQGLLDGLNNLVAIKHGARGFTAKPAEGQVLESRLFDDVRKFFRVPAPDGRLPVKLNLWDRYLLQFHQFAKKFPIARPFYEMLRVSRAMSEENRIKLASGLAGRFEGNTLIDDARTKQVAQFQGSQKLQDQFSQITQDLQELGDKGFDKELKVKGDIMQMEPDAVIGKLTPEGRLDPTLVESLMTKYGVADKDKPLMRTILDGTGNQIRETAKIMVGRQAHAQEILVSKAVSLNTDLSPEESRLAAKDLIKAIQLQGTDFNQAQMLMQQFTAKVSDPAVMGRIFDMATTAQDGVNRLERFLALRMPYFMSERRPGSYGLVWRDAKTDKILSQYWKSDADRKNYLRAHPEIKPMRTPNPQDRDYGIPPQVFNILDEQQKRLAEKATGLFGKEDGDKLAALLDFSTDLRGALNARDVLRMTTGRDLAPGREELNMFQTHQHYINSVTNAVRNSFVRLESELLFTSADFDNQPNIKQHIADHVKAVLTPDSQMGRMFQNLGFFYYLWANPSSLLLNATDQLMTLAPMLTASANQKMSIAGSYNIIRKANQMVIEAKLGKKYKDPEIQKFIDRAALDGVLPSWIAREMDHVSDLSAINRIRATTGKGLWQPFDMLKNKLYQAFVLGQRFYDTVPRYNSEVALVASLLHLRSPKGGGLTGDNLYREAVFLKDNVIPPGGKETRPGFFQHVPRSAAQAMWSLQTYVNGMTSTMGELIRKSFNPAGMTPAQAMQVRKAAAQALITQTVVSGVLGLPFATAAIYALQKLFPEHNIQQDLRDMLASMFGDDEATGQMFSSAVTMGIPNVMEYGPDIQGRLALAGVFNVSPYSGVGWEQLAGPTGGVVGKVLQGAQAGLNGEPLKTVRSLMPTGFQRIWQTLEQGNTYKTESGQELVDNLRPTEIASRILGFRPSRIAKIEEFKRLEGITEDAEKQQQTNWTKQQVRLMKDGRDAEVQHNIAQRSADKKGLYNPPQLANDVAREYEKQTTPLDLRKYGSKATVLQQKSLRGVLGSPYEGPSNMDRMLIQQQIAQRLGLGGPKRGQFRHAGNVDALLQMYPNLTTSQADVLLSHAAASRPTPDLYQELLAGGAQ